MTGRKWGGTGGDWEEVGGNWEMLGGGKGGTGSRGEVGVVS